MPTYEYVCDACEHRFELFQSITAKSVRKCPECGLKKVRRLIGAGSGFIFKGSGFYQTDYRSDEYKRRAKADSPSTEKKDKSDGSKSGGSSGSDSSTKKPKDKSD